MSTYEHTLENTTQAHSYKIQEQHLYGSSRIGMSTPNYEMVGATASVDGTPISHTLGKKQFEMGNHLGNVITVVSDRKIPIESTSTPTVIDYYLADVLSTSDYYPFGAPMPGRGYNSNTYRYGMNGKEKDDEIVGSGNSYNFGARIYDSRLGRWLSVDPSFNKYPNLSPYNFCANNPVMYVDPDGKDVILYHAKTRDEGTGALVWTKGEVSKTTEAVLRDAMSTPAGFAFISQFAKKGQTIAGYTFTEDGANSMHDLVLADISLENDNTNIPTNLAGEFGADYFEGKKNLTFTLTLISKGEDKYSLGETFTHESQLHGGIVETFTKAFKLGGKDGFIKAKDKENKVNPNGDLDHKALKGTDYLSPAFKRYNTQKWQLIKKDPKYLPAFQRAAKEAQTTY